MSKAKGDQKKKKAQSTKSSGKTEPLFIARGDEQIKAVREKISEVAERLAPAMEQAQKAVAPVIEAMKKHQPMFDRIAEAHASAAAVMDSLTKPETISIPARYDDYVRLDPRDRKLLEENRDKIVAGSTQNLSYDKKTKILSRTVDGKTLTSEFKDEGKRMNLLEYLLEAKTYIKTSVLRKKLVCPSDAAVSKISYGINQKASNDLGLDEKITEGRPGFGYHINPKITIHTSQIST